MSMDITLLTDEQIWGDKALQVMKAYGTKTGMSDLAIVLGGYMGAHFETSDNQKAGAVWSASSKTLGYVRAVRYNGDRDFSHPNNRFIGARPALPSSVTSKIEASGASLPRKKILNDTVDVVEYGEYPQTVAFATESKEEARKHTEALEAAYQSKTLQATGKIYTFDGEDREAEDKPFRAQPHEEYAFGGKRYIRVEAKPYNKYSVLSNGHTPNTGEACWIEVQPIEWLVDPSGVWVARQVLFSGVQLDIKKSYDGNFEATGMKSFLKNHFVRDMMQGIAKAVDAMKDAVSGVKEAVTAAAPDSPLNALVAAKYQGKKLPAGEKPNDKDGVFRY